MRSLMTKSSMISCACSSVSVPFCEVALEIDVEEGRDAAERHGRAILFLHSGEVAEVEPLHGFLGGARRPGDVEAVLGGHLLELAERADLLAQLFAVADDLVGRPLAVERRLLGLLALDQPVDAVERDPAVIADDPAAAVSVGKAGQDVRAAAAANVLRYRRRTLRRCGSCGTW